ncbi:hypothetical protein GQ43DRAFT_430962 [Delitschia confertaspora ATCC 74209]|uniref:Uncharacterized protein n=1 Tax=Delitschia confertaspora ATCC 74209 TaxID=1513339 RepID=A0A9P4MZT8_9PLEO|nr:hypothetical protein GQ43DRAFT_430962 [Delitschia confertaspora ATCC 74209]
MAEQQDFDEDLFADLYEGDDAIPANPTAPASKPAEPAPAKQEAHESAPAPVPEPAANTGDSQYGKQEEFSHGGDADMHGSNQNWNQNDNQTYDSGEVEREDNYGPINVKEDG